MTESHGSFKETLTQPGIFEFSKHSHRTNPFLTEIGKIPIDEKTSVTTLLLDAYTVVQCDCTLHGGSVKFGLSANPSALESLLGGEWLATNGIGGYAASTIPGLNTRKYHGLLVAAMSPPVRRMVMLSRVEETLWREGVATPLDSNEYPGVIFPAGYQRLVEFTAEPFPCWSYSLGDHTLQKQLRLLKGQNTVVLSYRLLQGDGPVDIEIRPLLGLRPIHELSFQWNGPLAVQNRSNHHHRVVPTSRTPELFFAHNGRFSAASDWYLNQIYRKESQRGYPGLEDLWTPGFIRLRLSPGHTAYFVCSTEPIEMDKVIASADRQFATRGPIVDTTLQALRRAAEQFVVTPSGDGSAEPMPSCNTAFPWSAPSGREMLIAFPGLFLAGGKFDEARALLQMFASKVRRGLMPSRFPEDGGEPEYHGADVSLWFVKAAWDYLRYTSDDTTVRRLLDVICQIISIYRSGTELGISVGPDGLLASRAPGIPTSWMDAKINDWVLTPRTGRPVELNALWYNAVQIAADLCNRYDHLERAKSLAEFATLIGKSFNARFWNESAGCCFDVVEDHGNDPSVRPNQLLAISLPFAALSPDRHQSVLDKVTAELLTPRGLRTLSVTDPSYQGRYSGGIVSRDRAYHNGSVFPWLLGPFVSAFMRANGRNATTRERATEWLASCIARLTGDGLGQLCELFDGDAPHAPGGAIACATAVGELLRCYTEDILGQSPILGPFEPRIDSSIAPPEASAVYRASEMFPFFK